jgi:hypothetical protein
LDESRKLQDALQGRRLTSLTKALSAIADNLGYRLKPPHTEIVRFQAKEEGDRFEIEFSAKLHLHYCSLEPPHEGLIFTVEFSGEALADSPNPPVDELFYAGRVDSFAILGYGARWEGKRVPTPKKFIQNLEVPSQNITSIALKDFLGRIAT